MDDLALVSDAGTLSHAELGALVPALAGDLAIRGVRPRDRVAFIAEPTLETALAIHAAWHLGATVVPLHPRLTAAEHVVLLDEARPVHRVALPLVPGPPEPAQVADPLAILFTSGTTGRAKAAVLSAAAFAAAADASAQNLGWHDDDRWLLALTPAHVGGLSILVRCRRARRTVVLGPVTAETIARHRVTLVSLVPTQAQRLLAAGWTPPSHVRALLLGGGPAPPALLAAADDRGWPVLTTYGLTEACAQVTTQRMGTRNRGEHGAGPPLPGVAVRISAAGTVQVGGPTLMSGYLHHPAPFTDDGWLETGDLGRLDDAGCLHILGRRTDLIVSGGENVYPAEVEAVLLEVPGVTAACVFGMDDELWGQIVCAALVCQGARADDEALKVHLAARLAAFKRPRRIARLDAISVAASGKIDRAATAARAARVLSPFWGCTWHMSCLQPLWEEPMTKKNEDMFKGHENQGEGNKTAAKDYDEAATKHAHGGTVDKEAKEARDALEGKDGAKLREAEAEGKKHIAEEDSEVTK